MLMFTVSESNPSSFSWTTKIYVVSFDVSYGAQKPTFTILFRLSSKRTSQFVNIITDPVSIQYF